MKTRVNRIRQSLLICITGMLPWTYGSNCLAQSIWTQIADMPVAKNGHSACFLDGKLYLTGGIDHYSPTGEIALLDLDVYDPVLDIWTEKADMLSKRFNFSSCAYDGKVLAIGGSKEIYKTAVSAIDAYDPLSDTWTNITHIPKPGVWQAAVLLDDKIYVFGGATTETQPPYDTVQIYDLLTDTWTKGAEMPTARIGHSATALNGKIYVMGGQNTSAGYVGMKTLEVFDPETNTWDVKTGMVVPRKNPYSCELNGKIYVFGGMSGNGGWLEGGEIYDPQTDSWKELSDAPRVLGGCAGSPLNGKVYIGGGHASGQRYQSWYIYDPSLDPKIMVSIPDTAFLNALIAEGVDSNEDSLISNWEAEEVTHLNLSGFWGAGGNIYDMSGVEAFIHLDTLDCSYNHLTSLNLSGCNSLKYLDSHVNEISSLDVSVNTELLELHCDANPITSLDISSNIALRRLGCGSTGLTNLDISNNTSLTYLELSYMPSLSKVCVWEGFDEDSLEINTEASPNIYFTTETECDNSTKVGQNLAEELLIYPNPAGDLITIETVQPGNLLMKITSMNGQLLFSDRISGTTCQIDLSSFRKGIYFITIRSKDLVTTRKIIKM